MALFFDQDWFDAELARTGASRADVARLLSLTPQQVEELWKDQRELTARDVALLGRFLNHPARVISERAGVSTPVPQEKTAAEATLDGLHERIDRLEAQVTHLLAEIDRLKASKAG
ncbi:MAG: DNA-binding protein [Alphaproteobacteria bacterium]|nr:DNA-binding protein [Alphaproteobacteria bacterium]